MRAAMNSFSCRSRLQAIMVGNPVPNEMGVATPGGPALLFMTIGKMFMVRRDLACMAYAWMEML